MKLKIELVPKSSWYSNVRSNVSKERWDEIRKECYKRANYVCEICGDVGTNQGYNHKVECHEIWNYDDKIHEQKLSGLISLCPKCHQVKHIGLAQLNGKFDDCVLHMSTINGLSYDETMYEINRAFDVWKERSQHDWNLDISYLDGYGKQLDINELMKQFNKK